MAATGRDWPEAEWLLRNDRARIADAGFVPGVVDEIRLSEPQHVALRQDLILEIGGGPGQPSGYINL